MLKRRCVVHPNSLNNFIYTYNKKMDNDYITLINEMNLILEKQSELIKEVKELKKKLYYSNYYKEKKTNTNTKKIIKQCILTFD